MRSGNVAVSPARAATPQNDKLSDQVGTTTLKGLSALLRNFLASTFYTEHLILDPHSPFRVAVEIEHVLETVSANGACDLVSLVRIVPAVPFEDVVASWAIGYEVIATGNFMHHNDPLCGGVGTSVVLLLNRLSEISGGSFRSCFADPKARTYKGKTATKKSERFAIKC